MIRSVTQQPGRRDVLRAAGLAGIAATLAACTSDHPSPTHTRSRTRSVGTPPAGPGTSSSATSSAASSTPGPSTSGGSSPVGPTSSGPGGPGSTTGAGRPRPDYARLKSQLSGTLARPGDRAYKPGQLLYNPRFRDQRAPQAIAYCARPADVVACVRFAADTRTPIRIRNGGHSYGGWSSGPGLVVDLAAMKAIRVNHAKMTATVEAGAVLAEVYAALAGKGVSIGGGSCPTVGITGLTLGGGVGLLTRAYGLTCDQLESVEIVTADGRLRTADAHTHSDLFWALRGGGGSFGAVTKLTFRVRRAPMMDTFAMHWPLSSANDVLPAWQHWIDHAPREMMSTCKLLANSGGSIVEVLSWWIGSRSPGRHISSLRKATPAPTSSTRSRADYLATMFTAAGCSPSESAGSCVANGWAASNRDPASAASAIVGAPLPRKAIAALVDALGAVTRLPGPVGGAASFDAFGGAVGDLDPDATAFRWRHGLADIQYSATWSSASATHTAPYDRYVHRQRETLRPWLGDAAYVNYADPSMHQYAKAYWGPNLTRLRKIKHSYDPHNLFSFPQSVPL
jgi:FAD/FMN-containing dehydrogenase